MARKKRSWETSRATPVKDGKGGIVKDGKGGNVMGRSFSSPKPAMRPKVTSRAEGGASVSTHKGVSSSVSKPASDPRRGMFSTGPTPHKKTYGRSGKPGGTPRSVKAMAHRNDKPGGTPRRVAKAAPAGGRNSKPGGVAFPKLHGYLFDQRKLADMPKGNNQTRANAAHRTRKANPTPEKLNLKKWLFGK